LVRATRELVVGRSTYLPPFATSPSPFLPLLTLIGSPHTRSPWHRTAPRLTACFPSQVHSPNLYVGPGNELLRPARFALTPQVNPLARNLITDGTTISYAPAKAYPENPEIRQDNP